MDSNLRVEALKLAVAGGKHGTDALGVAHIYEGYLNGTLAPASVIEPEALVPACSVRASIKPDYLVCLDDGKQFKSLKRHLATLGMTPDSYRERWGLKADYPMVAPSYSAQRSKLAKKMGLGKVAR